jgi:RPA family protein
MQQEVTLPCPTAVRVFFDELAKSDLVLTVAGVPALVTPTAACCHRLFAVGTLEAIERRGRITRLQLTDTTGSLTLYTKQSSPDDRAEVVERGTPIAFLGTVHPREVPGKGQRAVILADQLAVVAERVRTAAILMTAKRTMERIEELRAALHAATNGEHAGPGERVAKEAIVHYALDHERLDALAHMAITAVKRAWEGYRTATRALIVELLRSERGMERAKVMSALQARGYPTAWVEAMIEELIMDGQCSERESGLVRC